MDTKKILVIDDETDLVELVSYNLGKQGYKVSSASSGEEGFDRITRQDFDLVILDLMLPGMQGEELCRLIRSNPKTESMPVIMLTARGEVGDRVRGLESGADDYLAKPFSPKELVARVQALLRRSSGRLAKDKIIRLGDLVLDREAVSATKKDVPLHLSATEFKLLWYLAERKGRVFSRDQLLDAVWKNETFVEPRTVDVHIRRLRARIEDNPARPLHIKTRRGVGYYVE